MPSKACPTSSEKDFSPVPAGQCSVVDRVLTSGTALGGPLGSKLLAGQASSVGLAGGGVDRSAGTGHIGRRRQAAASDRALVVLVGHYGALGWSVCCVLFANGLYTRYGEDDSDVKTEGSTEMRLE